MAASLAKPAAAQEVGVYAGTSADGQDISFTVADDPNNGELELVSAGINFSAPCKNSTYVLNSNWGFGLSSDITNGKVSFVNQDNYFKFTVKLTFSADGQSATGFITSVSPTLYPATGTPTHSLFCTSPRQALSLTLQPADAPAIKVEHQSTRRNAAQSGAEADNTEE
jgi:hypothetical protein